MSAEALPTPERENYAQIMLTGRLRAALARLNPHLEPETLEGVLRRLQQAEMPSLVEENRRLQAGGNEGSGDSDEDPSQCRGILEQDDERRRVFATSERLVIAQRALCTAELPQRDNP